MAFTFIRSRGKVYYTDLTPLSEVSLLSIMQMPLLMFGQNTTCNCNDFFHNNLN